MTNQGVQWVSTSLRQHDRSSSSSELIEIIDAALKILDDYCEDAMAEQQ
jgi:hypothetical protein